MILKETNLMVLDNTGALKVKCFHVYGKKTGFLGDCLLVSIKRFISKKKVKKGEIYKAIIVNIVFSSKRKVGIFFNHKVNAVVLWKRNDDGPLGTRIKGFVPRELRFYGYLKLIMLSKGCF